MPKILRGVPGDVVVLSGVEVKIVNVIGATRPNDWDSESLSEAGLKIDAASLTCEVCRKQGAAADLGEAVESALKKRRHIGPDWLFPSAGNPVRYEEASVWLREAEKQAGLEPQKGTLWHAYRRLWASSRKDSPDVDVAQAGGWLSLDALKTAYQQPDDATMLRVVTHQTELRDVR